jgi:hypothetical protein
MLSKIYCNYCSGPLEPVFQSCLPTKTGTIQYMVASCIVCNKVFQIRQEWEAISDKS